MPEAPVRACEVRVLDAQAHGAQALPRAPLDLKMIPCGACGGDGYALAHGEGRSDLYGAALPTDDALSCEVCSGFGELEVCACCGEALSLKDGLEVCGCVAATLQRAA